MKKIELTKGRCDDEDEFQHSLNVIDDLINVIEKKIIIENRQELIKYAKLHYMLQTKRLRLMHTELLKIHINDPSDSKSIKKVPIILERLRYVTVYVIVHIYIYIVALHITIHTYMCTCIRSCIYQCIHYGIYH